MTTNRTTSCDTVAGIVGIIDNPNHPDCTADSTTPAEAARCTAVHTAQKPRDGRRRFSAHRDNAETDLLNREIVPASSHQTPAAIPIRRHNNSTRRRPTSTATRNQFIRRRTDSVQRQQNFLLLGKWL